MLLKYRSPIGLCLLGLVGGLIGACSSGGDFSTSGGSPALSFSKVVFEGQMDSVSHSWVEESTTKCMKSAGFDYTPKKFEAEKAVPVETREYRAEFGFGFAVGDEVVMETTTTLDDPATAGLSEEQAQAQIEEELRCKSEAQAELMNQVIQVVESVPDAERTKFEQARDFSDPRVVEAVDGWRECMAQAGFINVSDPGDVYELASSFAGKKDRLGDEISLALADWDCSVPVQETMDTVYAELDGMMNDRYTRTLNG